METRINIHNIDADKNKTAIIIQTKITLTLIKTSLLKQSITKPKTAKTKT